MRRRANSTRRRTRSVSRRLLAGDGRLRRPGSRHGRQTAVTAQPAYPHHDERRQRRTCHRCARTRARDTGAGRAGGRAALCPRGYGRGRPSGRSAAGGAGAGRHGAVGAYQPADVPVLRHDGPHRAPLRRRPAYGGGSRRWAGDLAGHLRRPRSACVRPAVRASDPGRAGRQSGDDAGPAAAGRGPAPRRRAAPCRRAGPRTARRALWRPSSRP